MKNRGREIEVFGEILNTLMKGNTKVSTYPAIVTEVDWEAKTATVKGVIDDLEFYDVLLGLGSFYVKPKKGSKCLIGVILSNEAHTFMISAEDVEQFSLKTGETNILIKEEGLLISRGSENLKKVMNDYFTEFGKLCDQLSAVIVAIGVSPNVPVIQQIKSTVLVDIKQRLNSILTD